MGRTAQYPPPAGRAIVPDEDLATWFATEIGLTEITEREREREAKAKEEADDFFSMLREFPTVSHE